MKTKTFLVVIILLLPLYASFQQQKNIASTYAFSPQYELSDQEKEKITKIISSVVANYYTFKPNDYLQKKSNLEPLLTDNFKTDYLSKAKEVTDIVSEANWSSNVNSYRVLGILGSEQNTANAFFEFQAEVSSNGKVYNNKYTTMIELKRQGDSWLISNIENEVPSELNL